MNLRLSLLLQLQTNTRGFHPQAYHGYFCGQRMRTTGAPVAGWWVTRQPSPRLSLWRGSRTAPHWPGRAALVVASLACPPDSQSVRSPHLQTTLSSPSAAQPRENSCQFLSLPIASIGAYCSRVYSPHRSRWQTKKGGLETWQMRSCPPGARVGGCAHSSQDIGPKHVVKMLTHSLAAHRMLNTSNSPSAPPFPHPHFLAALHKRSLIFLNHRQLRLHSPPHP